MRLLCVGISAILWVSLGCTSQSPNQVEDSIRAKYVLVTALDAWRSGRVKTLGTRNPPIRFADDDEKAGCELLDYEFEDEAASIKPFQNVGMVLSLKDKRGQISSKNVRYQVCVEPRLTVLRTDN